MESTSSAAVVEPKKKLQNPAARAKRLKRPLVNPDFAEAVSFERAAVKKVHDELQILHDEHMVVMKERNEEQAKVVDSLVLQLDYIEQLKENKKLNKLIETQNRTIKLQDAVIGNKDRAINALKGILELDKKETNPNRVTGGKRQEGPTKRF